MPRSKLGGWPYSNPPNTQFTLNTQSTQARGLVGWWPTVGSQGSVIVEQSGRARGGQLTGVYSRSGYAELGQAVYYGGGYATVAIADGSVLDFSTNAPMCMSAWIRPDSPVTSANSNDWQYVLNKGFDGVLNAYFLGLVGDGANTILRVGSYDGTSHAANYTWTGISAGTVYHTIGQYTGSAWQLFVNGRLVAESTTDGPENNSISGVIGALNNNGAYQRVWDGLIGDVRVYNRALTPAEVWQLYDPATRWELYKPVMPSEIVFAGGVTIPLFMHHYRQLRIGNGL